MRNLHSPIMPPFDEFKGEGIKGRDVEAITLQTSLTLEEIEDAITEHLAPHLSHPWEKVGRCVYCGPCGTRLYQGDMPDDHPKFVRPRRLNDADRMRAMWGMDNRR